jgi:hypothetical protein
MIAASTKGWPGDADLERRSPSFGYRISGSVKRHNPAVKSFRKKAL